MDRPGQQPERLVVVSCPPLQEEDEGGSSQRAFQRVLAVVEAFCPWVDAIRPGVCALPSKGPVRYFGGEAPLASRIIEALAAAGLAGAGRAGIGIADGLFAAVVAAQMAAERTPEVLVVPPGATSSFLAPLPVADLGRPDMADLLVRLGIRTLGMFAGLDGGDVAARFGSDGAACHRVAAGRAGELPGIRRPPRPADRLWRRADRETAPRPGATASGPGPAHAGHLSRQAGFWGETQEAAERTVETLRALQEIVGPGNVLFGRLQGGRSPAEWARLVPWAGKLPRSYVQGPKEQTGGPPWPGRLPPPLPVVVFDPPQPAALLDAGARSVGVTARGAITAPPARISAGGGPWEPVVAWAGPWPADERWWTSRHRRRARIQVVTAGGAAHLLAREGGGWWIEATYD
ncbi:MAG: hypothetical protein M0020_05335 [Actinomycetota bacterium]|nr:hypothetical protein [Actinomycetota bacterium]